MGFTDLFIRRHVATTLISIGMLLFGVMGYLMMPTTDMPNVDFPTIQVSAGMPGANPETMASTVATPLEGAFADISDVVSMTSSSSTGQTAITLQFGLDRNIDAAAQDVQAAISKAVLPQGLPRPPVFSKVNPSDQPILYITMGSETLPLSTVNQYADLYVAKRISTIKGVSQVVVYGEQKYAVRILLDPKVLVSREIGLDDVQGAVARENVNIPTGSLDGQYKSRSINTEGQLMRASDYRPIIVAYRGGRPIRLEELGEVVDSVYLNKMAAWWKGQRALILAVKRQPGANTIAAVDAIRQILPEIENELPGSIQMGIIYDQSESIRESVADVKFTLIMAVVLVILVVALFLRNITATVVTSLAVPMSLIPTFAVMKALGFSLDNLSLMALTLSVGFVVDDAIVMLENVVRHMEMGKGPFEAALDGAREIAFTILSMTLSLAVVFLPIVFMSGMVGRILSEFAITLIVAILVSGFVSLTLTPMMASRFLRPMKGRAGSEGGHGEGREDHEA
ncbi:MAG: efflux RND transporter permease subunit, partial [Desulfobacterales bacterium]|nr:efflux RND transporter permease subunit [Desulfobacterales bacterium]